jgi:putative ABC transport system substrate-binding protein
MKKFFFVFCLMTGFFACKQTPSNIPVVGFADAFEDNTIEQAKQGFIDAFKKNGFDESKNTVKIIYRNAQGEIPKLTQIM